MAEGPAAKTVRQTGEHGHHFVQARFQLPTVCRLCTTNIWGLGKNGYECRNCRFAVHIACVQSVPNNCFKAYLESTKSITQSIAKGAVPLIHVPKDAIAEDVREREREVAGAGARGGEGKEKERLERDKDKGRVALMEPMRGAPRDERGLGAAGEASFPYDALHRAHSPKGGRKADLRALAAELAAPGTPPPPPVANMAGLAPHGVLHAPSPRSPSPRGSLDESDLSAQLENLALEAARLRYKTRFVHRRIAEVSAERASLERALADAAAERERLRFALSHAEFAVAAAYDQLRHGVHTAAAELTVLSEQSDACATHFTRLAALMGVSAERITSKQVAALQTAGLKLEELMEAHALLRQHNTALQRQKLRLREHNHELGRRVAALTALEAEVALQARRANGDAKQLNAAGASLCAIQEQLSTVSVEALPSRSLQGLLHDLNQTMQAFSTPLEPVAHALGSLRPAGEEGDGFRWMGSGADRLLKAATVNALVERLTSEAAPERDFVRRFLLTFRLFLAPLDLLEKLIVRFCVTPALRAAALSEARQQQQPVRLRVLAALKAWLEAYPDDWSADLFELARAFLDHTVRPAGLHTSADSISALIHKRERDAPTPPPRDVLPVVAVGVAPVTDAAELARQLTVRAAELFARLPLRELLAEAAARPERRTPRLHALLASSRHVSGWAAALILQMRDVMARQVALNLVLGVARECLALNNFQTCADLMAALASPPIARLRVTWGGADNEKHAALTALFADNYRLLRQSTAQAKPPCVPFVGQVLGDVTALMEGTPDMLNDAFVNWYKLDSVAEALFQLPALQGTAYTISAQPHVLAYVFDHQVYSPEQAEEMSASLEL